MSISEFSQPPASPNVLPATEMDDLARRIKWLADEAAEAEGKQQQALLFYEICASA